MTISERTLQGDDPQPTITRSHPNDIAEARPSTTLGPTVIHHPAGRTVSNSGCHINPTSNRTCERGVSKCEIHHTDAAADKAAKFWRETGTDYIYEFIAVAQAWPGGEQWVIYRQHGPTFFQTTFAMLADEFHDGRFEQVIT